MISRYLNRAVKDITAHRFLNAVTVITIALSILVVCAFGLFFINVGDMLSTWEKGIRIMAYLRDGTHEAERLDARLKIESLPGVRQVEFISRETALSLLREQMQRQSSLLDDLDDNPLPDAFEIRMDPKNQTPDRVEQLAVRIESLPVVDDVEYGQQWVGRLTAVLDLFRFAGLGLGGLFCIATVFIAGNTIRLMLYNRKDEIEIMRLVGASDTFIKAPFYIQGLIQGLLGGVVGITVLYVIFKIISTNMANGFAAGFLSLRFFSPATLLGILICSMFVGWLGGFLSLRQFFKSL